MHTVSPPLSPCRCRWNVEGASDLRSFTSIIPVHGAFWVSILNLQPGIVAGEISRPCCYNWLVFAWISYCADAAGSLTTAMHMIPSLVWHYSIGIGLPVNLMFNLGLLWCHVERRGLPRLLLLQNQQKIFVMQLHLGL